MCDYVYTRKTPDQGIVRVTETYCTHAPQFWVQSLLSQHNSLACSHHLARIVRQIEAEARKFDLCVIGEDAPDMRYERKHSDGKPSPRVTREAGNWARVTVKPYTPKK